MKVLVGAFNQDKAIVRPISEIVKSPTKLGCALSVELAVPLVGEDAGLAEPRVDPALLGQRRGDEEQEQGHYPLHDGLCSASLTISPISRCIYRQCSFLTKGWLLTAVVLLAVLAACCCCHCSAAVLL